MKVYPLFGFGVLILHFLVIVFIKLGPKTTHSRITTTARTTVIAVFIIFPFCYLAELQSFSLRLHKSEASLLSIACFDGLAGRCFETYSPFNDLPSI